MATKKPAKRQFTDAQRAQLMEKIDKKVLGGVTVRQASKDAGVHETLYYYWRKKAGLPASPVAKVAKATKAAKAASASSNGDAPTSLSEVIDGGMRHAVQAKLMKSLSTIVREEMRKILK